jgi:glycerol-3-phosphate dehydrogenase
MSEERFLQDWPKGREMRAEAIRRLKGGRFDLLVIGGGATGTGIAVDAATRGLRTALVERADFASGTSSRSTKLIHGGVRYLEQAVKKLDRGQYELVRHALTERATFLANAPHLSRRLALLTPTYSPLEQLYYWLGLKAYDLLAGKHGIGSTMSLSRAAALRAFPALDAKRLGGAVVYYDGQFDDARVNVALALTAERAGAVLLNYAEVIGISGNGEAQTVAVRDGNSGDVFEVGARVVINATGPFTDAVRHLDDPGAEPLLETSSGVHITLAGELCPPDMGMLIPKTDDGGVLFVLPWLGKSLIGTTDEPEKPIDNPVAHEAAIAYLLSHVNRYFSRQFGRSDVLAAWSGFRPLVGSSRAAVGATAALVRDHVVVESRSGLVTVTGGKWTSYRQMASDAVDYVIRTRGLIATSPCITKTLRLAGGNDYDPDGWRELVAGFGFEPDIAEHLNHAYGDRAKDVASLAAGSGGQRLSDGYPYLEGEVVWAAREEYAQSVMDVLARRTRLAFLDRAAAMRCVARVADLLSAELGWDEARRTRELSEAHARLGS